MRVAEFYLLPDCHNGKAVRTVTGADAETRISSIARGDAADGSTLSAPLDGVPVNGQVRLYDESCDSMQTIKYDRILEQCQRFIDRATAAAQYRSSEVHHCSALGLALMF